MSKRRKASREKLAIKLERKPKWAEYGERNAKENKKRHNTKSSRKQTEKGSCEKEEEVGRVLSGFSLTLRPGKIQTFFYQSSFDNSFN